MKIKKTCISLLILFVSISQNFSLLPISIFANDALPIEAIEETNESASNSEAILESDESELSIETTEEETNQLDGNTDSLTENEESEIVNDQEVNIESTIEERTVPLNWSDDDDFSWIVYNYEFVQNEINIEIGFKISKNSIKEGDYATLDFPEEVSVLDNNNSKFVYNDINKEIIGTYEINDHRLCLKFKDSINNYIENLKILPINLKFQVSDLKNDIIWNLNKNDLEPFILKKEVKNENNLSKNSEISENPNSEINTFAIKSIASAISGGSSQQRAKRIQTNVEYSDYLPSNTAERWYKLNIASPGYISITFKHAYLNTSSLWKVQLYDKNTKELINFESNREDTEYTSFKSGVPAGDYYVKVSCPLYFNSESYSFKVNYTQSSVWETEFNDSFNSADSLDLNKVYRGVLANNSDKDYFKTNLKSNSNASLILCPDVYSEENSYSRWNFKIYDSSTRKIKEGYFSPNESISLDLSSYSAGNYYIEVSRSYGSLDGVAYQIKVSEKLPFVDVPNNHWGIEIIREANNLGLIQGYDSTHFGPFDNLTRGMAVTILWRMAGSPSVAGSNSFKDVNKKDWFNTAITWASKNHVVHGYSSTKFGPYDYVTREQLAVMIVNYLYQKGIKTNSNADLSHFKDAYKTNGYALPAMKYCVSKGILSGADGGTNLNPHSTATRVEAAKMLTLTYHIQK